jgi:2-polyprenyl-3-methyl-5-hydroxy-6-metoxy-1,4-benzoquinol methylase
MRLDEIQPHEIIMKIRERLGRLEYLAAKKPGEKPEDATVEKILAPVDPMTFRSLEDVHRYQAPGSIPPGAKLRWLKKVLLRLMRIYTREQTSFNAALVRITDVIVYKLDEAIRAYNDTILHHEKVLDAAISLNKALAQQVEDLQRRLDSLEKNFTVEKNTLHFHIQSAKEQASSLVDNTVRMFRAELGQTEEKASSALEALRAKMAKLELLYEVRRALRSEQDQIEDEELYVNFENTFRGTEDAIRERQAFYVQLFQTALADRGSSAGDGLILDVGCGRGELLCALKDAGLNARGVDLSRKMVDYCRWRGVDAVQADAIEYMAGLDDGSLRGIVALEFIEHIGIRDLYHFFRLAHKKLERGGLLVVETINPESLYAMRWFYLDFSHHKPLVSAFVEFLLEQAGFKERELFPLSPVEKDRILDELPDAANAVENRNIDKLNTVIFGHQEYAIKAVKT